MDDFLIVAALKTKDKTVGSIQDRKEVIDCTESADEAEMWLTEYGIAFGPSFAVWIEDECGNRISEAPFIHAREHFLSPRLKKAYVKEP